MALSAQEIFDYQTRKNIRQLASKMGEHRMSKTAGPVTTRDEKTQEVLLPTGQAAKLLKLPTWKVRYLFGNGHLRGKQDKEGKKEIRIFKSSIDAFLAAPDSVEISTKNGKKNKGFMVICTECNKTKAKQHI